MPRLAFLLLHAFKVGAPQHMKQDMAGLEDKPLAMFNCLLQLEGFRRDIMIMAIEGNHYGIIPEVCSDIIIRVPEVYVTVIRVGRITPHGPSRVGSHHRNWSLKKNTGITLLIRIFAVLIAGVEGGHLRRSREGPRGTQPPPCDCH